MNMSIDEQYPTFTASSFTSGSEASVLGARAIPVRVRDMAALRGLGYTCRQIGQQFGISAQAVSVMLGRYRKRLDSLSDAIELHSLSCRAANVLGRHGISSRQEAVKRDIVRLLQHEKNCGLKTIMEIQRWINQETPADERADLLVANTR